MTLSEINIRLAEIEIELRNVDLTMPKGTHGAERKAAQIRLEDERMNLHTKAEVKELVAEIDAEYDMPYEPENDLIEFDAEGVQEWLENL